MMKALVLLAVGLSVPILLHGRSDYYSCTVDTEQDISDDGELKALDPPGYVGKDFHVDRDSGLVLGEGFLGNGGGWERHVIRSGDPHTSFMLFSISRGEIGAYLTINEWVERTRKPFVYVIGNMILTGTCE